nr:reverse transcriptase domain-containing protein [Tanacetum cinerariifolium]
MCGSSDQRCVAGQEAVNILTLAIVDPPRDTTMPTTPPKRFLIQGFIGQQFTKMPSRNKYTLVAFDYLLKWVEAKALPTNDARVVVKFLKSLFSQFGTPKAIISDRGTYFCNDQFTKVMSKYGVTHHLSPPSDERSEHKAYWALKHANFDLKTTEDHRKLQLNELHELRDQAYENSLIYKEKRKKLHDSKIKNRIFNVGDQVLLFNSRLKIFLRNLKTRWSGPFTITEVYPYGTAKLSHADGSNFKQRMKNDRVKFKSDAERRVVGTP